MNIVFMGMKHCGKSTHGRAFAEYLNCPFYDTDDLISDNYREITNEHVSVREIFQRIGEEGFKKLEAQIIETLHSDLSQSTEHHVISMGGGLPINPALNTLLPDLGVIVYLQCNPDVLFERIMNSGNVPFLDQQNPRADFDKIYQERVVYYERYATFTLYLDDMPINEAAAYIIKQVNNFIDHKIEE